MASAGYNVASNFKNKKQTLQFEAVSKKIVLIS